MRVYCTRLGAQFTCKRSVVTQGLRFQRVAAQELKESRQRSTLAGLTILTLGF